jgi:dTDP-6-deoxy-L-talose 4-dehydrogenase (NAD+)
MTTTVLLTGATGFVGRQILQALSSLGLRIKVVIREGTQRQLLVQDSIERIVTTDDVFAQSADWWTDACTGADIVIHAAWYTEPGKYLQSGKNIDCLVGTLLMAKGAAQAGIRRFIGIGTCFEYDLTGGTLSVHTALHPVTPYAATKAAVFTALSQYLPAQGVAFAWCRLFYLYGEGEDERRLVPYIRTKLASGELAELTSGTQTRDFLNVREAARLIAKVALEERQGAVNVCSGVPITVRELATQIADEYGRRDLLGFGMRPDNLVDPPIIVGIRNC